MISESRGVLDRSRFPWEDQAKEGGCRQAGWKYCKGGSEVKIARWLERKL